jgi:hypothetical protein
MRRPIPGCGRLWITNGRDGQCNLGAHTHAALERNGCSGSNVRCHASPLHSQHAQAKD